MPSGFRFHSSLSLSIGFGLVLTLGAFAAGAIAGCADGENVAAVPKCDDAKCAPGNKCLGFEAEEVKCRKLCSSNTDAETSCPYGFTCTPSGDTSICVKQNNTLTQAKGQWGEPCNAAGGFDANPDCDAAQGFLCYGLSKTDGAAYCTRYDCTNDRECGPGFYCGTINVAPNVTRNDRAVGQTARACLRRTYCAPCGSDIDCPTINGVKAHCVPDASGATYCAPECSTTTNCNNEAKCVGLDGLRVCYPRAGVCVGDGSLCSPCRSDADCPNGACVKGQYTTEKFCTVKSGKKCVVDTTRAQTTADFDCPTLTTPKVSVRCLGGKGAPFETEIPADHCHGVVAFGGSGDPGCWTPER